MFCVPRFDVTMIVPDELLELAVTTKTAGALPLDGNTVRFVPMACALNAVPSPFTTICCDCVPPGPKVKVSEVGFATGPPLLLAPPITMLTFTVWNGLPLWSNPVVDMEIVPVQVVFAAAVAFAGVTCTFSVVATLESVPELGVTVSHPWPQVFVPAKALKLPLPLIVICCAGGAAPPGVATLNVNVPVPLEGVELMLKFTVALAVKPPV